MSHIIVGSHRSLRQQQIFYEQEERQMYINRPIGLVAIAFLLAGVTAESSGQEKIVLVNGSQKDMTKLLHHYGRTHRVVAWNIRVIDDKSVYSARMKKGDVPFYQLRSERTKSAFDELKRVYAEQGYTLKKQIQYKVKGKNLYAGYWQKSSSGSSLAPKKESRLPLSPNSRKSPKKSP